MGNLSSYSTKRVLLNLFEKYGSVQGIIIHRRIRNERGSFGFIKYNSKDEAKEAIKRLQSRWVQNWRIKVEFARRQMREFVGKVVMRERKEDAEAVNNQKIKENKLVEGVENVQVLQCVTRSWLILTKEMISMKEVKIIMENIDVKISNMVKWGSHGLIIICENEEESTKLKENKEKINEFFIQLEAMENKISSVKRYVWIDCKDIPLQVWSRDTMGNIAALWGKLIALHPETESIKQVESAKILIQTEQVENIEQIIKLNWKGRQYPIMVREFSPVKDAASEQWWRNNEEEVEETSDNFDRKEVSSSDEKLRHVAQEESEVKKKNHLKSPKKDGWPREPMGRGKILLKV